MVLVDLCQVTYQYRRLKTVRKVSIMIRIKKNKPVISADTKSFRAVRRFSLNRTYTPIKIGAVTGYIILGMLSASTSMFGILIGTMIRIAGF